MTNWMTIWSTYLFARPSWIEGAARAMDLGGTLQEYNYAPSGSDADTLAMMADWQAIGDDLRKAVENIGSEAKVEISEQFAQSRTRTLFTVHFQVKPSSRSI